MPKKMTKEEFVARANEIHNGKYDYSKTVYIEANKKSTIICPIHGDFEIRPATHLLGGGCQTCSGKPRYTTETLIEAFKKVHGDKFDYSNVVHTNNKATVDVLCKTCNSLFYPTTGNHLSGSGCPSCAQTRRLSQDDFLRRAREIHGNTYIYDKAVYTTSQAKLIVVCNKHGEFEQQAHMHLSGQGCPKCIGLNKTTDDFIHEARKVHGDKYDYSTSVYTTSKNKLSIICEDHGVFEQSPNSHLRGRGCPICGGNQPHTTESFIKSAQSVHGNTYDYSKVVYGKSNTAPVTITCREHGDFSQRPMDHLEGCGCQKCNNYGKMEQTLRDFVESLGFSTTKDKTILDGKEIDIYVPEKKIGFEYNGLFWHSEARASKPSSAHKEKVDAAAKNGVRLIHIYEDDWIIKRSVVENFIKNALGISSQKVYARSCEVSYDSCEEFLGKYHIQGSSRTSSRSLVLKHNGVVVAAMQFAVGGSHRGKSVGGEFELIRYATSCSVIGGASKLLSRFVKDSNPSVITSYSDNDMYTGNMYKKLGFVLDKHVPPDYKIIDGDRRRHKSGYRKDTLAKKYPDKYDPNLTEHENCRNLRLWRIYNSGMKKWVWTKDSG